MAEETASLILKVDSTQVEKGSKSLKDFASAGATAEASLKKHGQAIDSANKTTAGFIASLERKIATDGKAASAVLRYDSALLAATKTQRNYIDTLIKQVEQQEKAGNAAEKTSFSMERLTKAAGAIGVAIAAVNTALSATRTYTEFSRSLANVSTLIEGTTEQMKALESASIALGTRYGKMPVEQAKTFYQVISSGITDVSKATDLLDSANKLSVAGFSDLFATADSMTSIMNAYGEAIQSTSDLSDILFVGTLAGKTTINELAGSLGRVAPIAKELNVGIDELVGSIAALTLGGIGTAEAVTGMRAILAAVAKPSAEAAKLAKQLGIEFDSASLKTKGFTAFLDDLKVKTGGSEQSLSILFGGVEALIPVMALSGEAGVKFNGIMKQMEDRAGATQTAFEKMEQSPGFRLDKLMANISAAGIKLGDMLATVLLPIMEKVSSTFNALFGSSMPVSAIEKQKQAIASMTKELESMQNRLNIPVIGGLIFDKRKADELSKSIENSIEDLKRLETEENKVVKTQAAVNTVTTKAIDLQDKLGNSREKSTNKTKAYNVEIYKLKEAEKQLAGAKDIEYQKLKRHEVLLNEAKQLTEQTRTAQEKYNATIQRYNELRPHLTAETYSRAVANTTKELERSRTEFDKLDQANNGLRDNWRSAWSNMEQTGRMAFTQFASHGIDSIKSIGEALKLSLFDLLYQLTARRWLINIGASLEGTLFGAAGSAAGSAAGAGLFTGGFGKGVTNLVGRGGSMLPGALGTFFGGMAGNGAFSAAGGAGTAFIGGSGTALGGTGMGVTAGLGARFGSMMSAAAAPLAIAFSLDAIGRLIGGNKKLGGAEKIPVIGGFLAGLFGRGPLKQKETTLTGDIGLGGLESGMLETVFKAKGGLFRSNKTDFARVDAITGEIWTDNQKQLGQFAKDLGKAAKDIFSAFNEAAKESSKIINATAENLGLSTESMKDFNYQLNLVSEKGKALTEEQIAEEIEKMTTAMTEKFIPNIKELTKVNESAIEALARLNNEFLATEQAARVLGMTLADAKVYVQGMGFELRTAFTDAAGGVDSFNSKVAFVAENFLTAEQRFSMGIETLNSQLTKAGVPLDATKESFYQLLRVTAAAGDAVKFGGLLDIAPLFAEIRDAQKAAAEEQKAAAEIQRKAAIETADAWIKQAEAQHKINVMNELDLAYSSLQRSIDAEKLKITNQYNDAIKESETRIKGVTDSISNLTDISKLLKSSVASMSGFDIVAARAQVSAAIASQDFSSPALRDAITALTQKGTGFTSKIEEQRYNAQNLTLLRSLDNVADSDLLLQQRSLAALQNAEKILKENYDAEIKRLDGIIDGFKQQIDALKQIDNSVLSIPGAIDRMGAAIAAAMEITAPLSNNNVVSISPSVAAAPVYDSPSPISNADILEFGRSHTPMEIYQAAIKYGISSARIAESGLATQDQINQFVKENKLASFDIGGRVPKTGIAMIHKDEQILTKDDNKSLKQSLEEMKKAIEVMTVTQNKINRRFDKWDAEGLPDTRVA